MVIKPELESPMFVDGSISSPYFNDTMQKELENAIEWLKFQTNIDSLTQNIAVIISEELLQENHKQLLVKHFSDIYQIPVCEEYLAINPQIRTIPICDAAKKEYLTNYENAQECIYWVLDEFWKMSAQGENKSCSLSETKYISFFCRLFMQFRAYNLMFHRYFKE